MAEKSEKPAGGPKFERERLVTEAQAVLGYPSHVVAGAMADHRGEGALTVPDAKAAVERFLKRGVKSA